MVEPPTMASLTPFKLDGLSFGESRGTLIKAVPRGFSTWLEIELEPELHLARSNGRVLDGSEGIVADSSVRGPEHRMIKRVSGIDPELEVHLLTYLELLPNGQIGRKVRWTADATHGSWSITQGERVRILQHVRIHKVVVHPIRTVATLGGPHNIGSLCVVCRQWLSAVA